MKKIKVLALTETPLNATGLGVYAEQLLSRLSSEPNFEVGALTCFGVSGDPRLKNLPYKVWQTYVGEADDEQFKKIVAGNKDSIIGAEFFERTCAEFQPDIVISWRDYEVDYLINNSPYRKFFKYISMPTVDSENRPNYEIDNFLRCDKLLTYTNFGANVLHNQCPKLAPKLFGIAPPAADYNIFSPVLDKATHKYNCGFSPNDVIIGTCNRNQPRKLFPELIKAFVLLLERFPQETLKLYLHTTYPDAAWDIPKLLLKAGIASKTYMTYRCLLCDFWAPAQYNGFERSICPKCNQHALQLITTENGLTREQLAELYGLFDVFVQPNSNEGFGMPMLEAAACGVPVVGTDYSAIKEILDVVGGERIMPIFYTEPNMERILTKIDPEDVADAIGRVIIKPNPLRQAIGFSSSLRARMNYDYDNSALAWVDCINSVDLSTNLPWDLQKREFNMPSEEAIAFLPDEEFIDICFTNIDSASTWSKAMTLKDLRSNKLTKKHIYNKALMLQKVYNYWEGFRHEKHINTSSVS